MLITSVSWISVSAAFIFLNSVSGITGLASQGNFEPLPEIFIMVIAGVAGSFLGAFLGTQKLNALRLTYVLAGVLLFASFKLFYF